jgi:hypothetical protein
MTRDPEGFKKATQTPFLERAGKGTLDKRVLQQWLSQDRLYAQAYVRFASLLLANIRLPAAVDPEDVNEKCIPSLIHTFHPLLPSFHLKITLPSKAKPFRDDVLTALLNSEHIVWCSWKRSTELMRRAGWPI